MKAITAKRIPPTTLRGTRISTKSEMGTHVFPYDHSVAGHTEGNYKAAIAAHARLHGLKVVGCAHLPDGKGYVAICE